MVSLPVFAGEFGGFSGHGIESGLEHFPGGGGVPVGIRSEQVLFLTVCDSVKASVAVEFEILVLCPGDLQTVDALAVFFCGGFVFGIVVLKDPLARVTFFTLTLWPETPAVDRDIGEPGFGDFRDRRQEIGKIDEIVAGLSYRDGSGAVDDERRVASAVESQCFLSLPFFVTKRIAKTSMGAVVGGVNDNRPFTQLEPVQHIDDPADAFVRVERHIAKMPKSFVFFVGGRPAVGCVWKRRVRQHHRVVDEERFVFVLRYKIDHELGENVRAVVLFSGVESFPVAYDAGIPVARAVCARIVPKTVGVETAVGGKRSAGAAVELPFSGDRGVVARVFHHGSEGDFVFVQGAEPDIVADAIAAGHDFHATGSAYWLGVAVVKLHSGPGEGIETWRGEEGAAVASVVVDGGIVGHDQDHIQRFPVGEERHGGGAEECEQEVGEYFSHGFGVGGHSGPVGGKWESQMREIFWFRFAPELDPVLVWGIVAA